MTKPAGKELLEALYLKQKKSIRDIAKLLDWKKDKVHRLLKKYDIKRDIRVRKSKLSGITLEYLEREFKTKSKKQVARELGISRASLYNYLSRLRNM